MSKKIKLSQWHDGSVKPVHVGPYEFKDKNSNYNAKDCKWFRVWNGKMWMFGAPTIQEAIEEAVELNSDLHDELWRGIVK